MASVDLKDAYYTVPIAQHHRKVLFLFLFFLFLFLWRGQFWQYDCMPNGLAFAPRKFAKLIKPVFAKMREEGHVSTFFVEDSLSVSESEREQAF